MANTEGDATHIGYAMFCLTYPIILALYFPWLCTRCSRGNIGDSIKGAVLGRRTEDSTDGASPTAGIHGGSDIQKNCKRTPLGLTMRTHCLVALLSILIAATGQLIVYRIVVADFLLGRQDAWFATKLLTTSLTVVALLFLFLSNSVLLGADSMPQNAKRFALAQFVALGTLLVILIGKIAKGVVYYNYGDCACP